MSLSEQPPSNRRLVPAVRWARLLRTTPQLSSPLAHELLANLDERWPKLQREHFKLLHAIDPGEWHALPDDGHRIGIEFGTPVLTFPRCTNGRVDVRVCVAACPAPEQGTKVWARVGASDRRKGIEGQLRRAATIYRKIAKRSSKWLFDEVRSELRRLGLRPKGVGEFEVAALSSADQAIGKLLAQLDRPSVKANALLAGSDASKRLNQYISDFAEEQRTWSHVKGATWFSESSMYHETSRNSDYSDVLYVMRTLKDRTQLLGIGFDRSVESKRASESTLEVSRLIARRV